jgi:hypothetical protein
MTPQVEEAARYLAYASVLAVGGGRDPLMAQAHAQQLLEALEATIEDYWGEQRAWSA